jgi:hypothetical protein
MIFHSGSRYKVHSIYGESRCKLFWRIMIQLIPLINTESKDSKIRTVQRRKDHKASSKINLCLLDNVLHEAMPLVRS